MTDSRRTLIERFRRTRATTEALAAPLSSEDQQLQSNPLASPTKWHRAHTTWFFETFVLQPAGIAPHDPRFGHLFNSYYESVGKRLARDQRGLVSRPSSPAIGAYRAAVDAHVSRLLETIDADRWDSIAALTELGIAHEEQHQELLLTDILHAFAQNPIGPVYRDAASDLHVSATRQAQPFRWTTMAGGVVEVGAREGTFCFDNEHPRHRSLLHHYAVANRLVTVGEIKAFIRAGGYDTPSLWLAQGFETARAHAWRAPGHVRIDDDRYAVFTLRGWRHPSDDEPASHLSYWEADAVARFLGARLPTEFEWERAAQDSPPDVGNFADGPLVPLAASTRSSASWFGDVWQWTRSSYDPYPGYRADFGGSNALGEYNGKFMAQQFVLRGGSCLSARGHLRVSYRNYWHPDTRFQMTGVRLVKDL